MDDQSKTNDAILVDVKKDGESGMQALDAQHKMQESERGREREGNFKFRCKLHSLNQVKRKSPGDVAERMSEGVHSGTQQSSSSTVVHFTELTRNTGEGRKVHCLSLCHW